MRVPFPVPMRGLGNQAQQVVGTNQTIAKAASIASAGAATTSGILAALTASAEGASLAGPIGIAVAGAISLGIALYNTFKGCGQPCIEASDYANQVEQILQQNVQNYIAAPVHYASLQAAALNNFSTAWSALEAACGQPALAQAGINCISQRQAGSCAYKTSPGGWQQVNGSWQYQYPGGNGSGDSCWNWFIGYHDPIANDPTVVPDPVPGAGPLSSLLSTVGISPAQTLFGLPIADVLMAGLGLLGLVWLSGEV